MIILFLLFYFCDHVLSQKYEGCFRSSALDPDLPTLILNHANAPTECIKECRSRYYMFAGLMNGQQCFCGSRYGRKGISTTCTFLCIADQNNYCGSQDAMSIYSTGQTGPSPPRSAQIIHSGFNNLQITWEPPNIRNGNITSYTLKAVVVETFASNLVPAVESQIQGGASNSTILQGLQPGTKYNISITAANTQTDSEPTYILGWTLIGPPNKPIMPKVIEQTSTTITVLLSEGSSEYGPVSTYQVFVCQPGTIPPSGPNVTYYNYETSIQQSLGYYTTGEFESSEFYKYTKFIVGDGKMIGAYYNAPLNTQVMPQIGLTVVSKFQRQVQYAYSDLINKLTNYNENGNNNVNLTTIILCVAIGLLGTLLIASIILYLILRQRHEKFRIRKLPEQQELTLQGPLYEVDNLAYIPEDVPERVNHYQELKKKVWIIPQNLLTINDTTIRRGRFGTIHTGVIQKNDKSCSVAVHSIADKLLKVSDKRHMLRELDVCIKASPMKYLADLIGTCETHDTLHVVLELPPQTLKNCLLAARSGNTFPVEHILPIGSMIASALQHLENYKIIHEYLCARSVGLSNEWIPKLMGHGISKYALEDIKYTRWMSVECLGNRKKHQPAVVWAFGVLLWEMLSMGGTPYSNFSLDSEVEEAIEQGVRLPQLPDTPDPLHEVMLSCWNMESQERPTFAELIRLDVISKPYCININDEIIPHKSAKLTGKKISSAMRAYLKRSEDYKEFMKKQIAEYDIGKRHLANIMGEDPENFTKEDINKAIRYLFPSGLYDREARPMMLHPIDVYGNRKEAEFDETGRPHHFLFYTTKPNYYEILHNIAESMIHLNKIEDQILERNIQLTPEYKINVGNSEWLQKKSLEKILLEELLDKEYDYFIKSMQRLVDHPVSKHVESFIMEYRRKLPNINEDMKIPQLEYDSDNRPFVLVDRCARKNTRGEVKVIGNGSGKITINGKDITYFDDMQCREQIIFPLIFTEMIDKVDIEATISGGGPTGQAGAVRFGIAKGLQSFVDSQMRERMRLAGLLTYDWRRRERKKWGQEGARRKFTWKKR